MLFFRGWLIPSFPRASLLSSPLPASLGGRREKRVGGWRDFQKGPKKTKVAKTWKQEESASAKEKPKFGVADMGDYKKDWK